MIAKAIIDLAHNLGMKVIAEGGRKARASRISDTKWVP